MEFCQSVGWADAVGAVVVVGPEVLMVGRLSNDDFWCAVAVCEMLVGWEALSVN
jgi:hypothetical protein